MTQSTSPCHDERGILPRSDGASIAYHRVVCPDCDSHTPTVIFLHGLMSDMDGGKAQELARHATEYGYNFIRFDMFGHGQSSGTFTDGCIGRWCEDTLTVIDELTRGPLVLIGSSMGGWVMLRVAMMLAERNDTRIKGLIGIAPAPDFTEEHMWDVMTQHERASLLREGIISLYGDAEQPYPISKTLILDGREHLLFNRTITFDGPVRILQGMLDTSVPWKNALRICDGLQSTDVIVDLIKDGDHRLSRPQDLARLTHTLEDLLQHIQNPWSDEAAAS